MVTNRKKMSLKKGRVYAGTAVHFHCNCSLTESQKMFFFIVITLSAFGGANLSANVVPQR